MLKCPKCGEPLKELFASLGKKGGKTVTEKKRLHLQKASEIRWRKEKKDAHKEK